MSCNDFKDRKHCHRTFSTFTIQRFWDAIWINFSTYVIVHGTWEIDHKRESIGRENQREKQMYLKLFFRHWQNDRHVSDLTKGVQGKDASAQRWYLRDFEPDTADAVPQCSNWEYMRVRLKTQTTQRNIVTDCQNENFTPGFEAIHVRWNGSTD